MAFLKLTGMNDQQVLVNVDAIETAIDIHNPLGSTRYILITTRNRSVEVQETMEEFCNALARIDR